MFRYETPTCNAKFEGFNTYVKNILAFNFDLQNLSVSNISAIL